MNRRQVKFLEVAIQKRQIGTVKMMDGKEIAVYFWDQSRTVSFGCFAPYNLDTILDVTKEGRGLCVNFPETNVDGKEMDKVRAMLKPIIYPPTRAPIYGED